MVKSSVNTPSSKLVKIPELIWSKAKYKKSPNAPEGTKHEKSIISLFQGNHVPKIYSNFVFKYREGSLYVKNNEGIPYEDSNIDENEEAKIWNEIGDLYGENIKSRLEHTKYEYDSGIEDMYDALLYFLGDIEIDGVKDRIIINKINNFVADTIEDNFNLHEADFISEFMVIANFLRLRKMEEDNLMQIGADLLKNTNESLKSTVEKVEKTLGDISKK